MQLDLAGSCATIDSPKRAFPPETLSPVLTTNIQITYYTLRIDAILARFSLAPDMSRGVVYLFVWVALSCILTAVLYPVFVMAGIPAPSRCVTDYEYVESRECALGTYDPVGLQSMIDRAYLAGWLNRSSAAMIAAIPSGIILALLLTALIASAVSSVSNRRRNQLRAYGG